MKKSNMSQSQIADAARLREIWERKRPPSKTDPDKPMPQGEFGLETGIGVQGMVHQYMAGLTPLNLAAVGKFAKGLGVLIDDISPSLADEIRELYKLCDPIRNQNYGVPEDVKAYIDKALRQAVEEGRKK